MTMLDTISLELGVDTLDINATNLKDIEVLQLLAEVYPKGCNFVGNNTGSVWVNPTELLTMAHPDGFGLEMVGIAHVAAEMIRIAAEPDRATLLGEAGVDRLIKRFIGLAKARAQSKRINQIHGYRFGVGAKVCGADRVEPQTLEIHPDGNVAKRLQPLFKGDLQGQYVLVFRHPFILGYVARIAYNDHLTKNLVMVNRVDFRKVTLGDYDGDSLNLFPIQDPDLADAIHEDIFSAVPGMDPTLKILGIESTDQDAKMWGENIFAEGKTTQQKLDQSFTKTIAEWIDTHAKMGDYANKYTPFAYRISDLCGLQASLGVPGAREASLLGAVLEETYYLGLSGGPEGLDEALETWYRRKLTKATLGTLFNGLRGAVDPNILTTQVKTVLIETSQINQMRGDFNDPTNALTNFGWLIGKGCTSDSHYTLNKLAKMAGDHTLPEEIRDSFIARMIFQAARKLSQTVRDRNQQEDAPSHQDESSMFSDEDVSELVLV